MKNKKLQKGEVCSSANDDLLYLKWKDKRDVLMISTYHDSSMVEKSRHTHHAEGGQESIQKPKVVEDYNMHMGGVDKGRYNIIR